jgi:DNA-binding LytR/AlgR family response regulator
MKVRIQENPHQNEPEAVIVCRDPNDADVQRALSMLSQLDCQLIGRKDGEMIPVNAGDVLYFDSVDKQTFMYTTTDVLETPLRLYMLEERLSGGSFFRASKNAVVNINKIASLKPEFGGRMEATLVNGERLVISRQYVSVLKTKLRL